MQSLSSLYYNPGIDEHVNLAPRAGVAYRIYDPDNNRKLRAGANYSYLTDRVDDTEQRGLLTVYKPWGEVHGHSVSAFLNLNVGLGVYWDFDLEPTYSYTQNERVMQGVRIPQTSHRAAVDMRASSSYHSPINITLAANAQREWKSLNAEPYRGYMAGQGAVALKCKFLGFRANVQAIYSYSPFSYDDLQSIDLSFTATYELTPSLQLSARGYNLMALGLNRTAQQSVTPLYVSNIVYRRMPGHFLVGIRYSLGKKKAKPKSLLDMLM